MTAPNKFLAAIGILASSLVATGAGADNNKTVHVSGTAIDFFSTATIHSQTPTPTGFLQESTNFIELSGDISGKIVYRPSSVFDFAAGTLTNTGEQMFNGSILGSETQWMWDDEFFFEANLFTGTTYGEVYLRRSRDGGGGEYKECDIIISGVGQSTPDGDAIVSYEGTCTLY